LANIVGSRSKHGVVVDFVRKLRQNPGELEILGDGTQSKSYLHVQDLVNAILHVLNTCARKTGSIEVYNVGSLDRVDVERIARIVSEEMGISNLKFKFTGGVDGGRGWKSDVKNMQLSIDKLKGTGWNPSLGSEEAIRKSCRELLDST
jgi:UDP-glucose 4-epimerase